MKKTIGMLLALLMGALLGFFGVFVSVFADGASSERYLTIAVILLAYGLLASLWGFLVPELGWKWGILLGLPGAVILLLYTLKEQNLIAFTLLYIILIFAMACLGGYLGAVAGAKKGT